MKFIVFTDLHAHNYKAFDENGSRLRNSVGVIDRVADYAIQNDIKYILFAGDLFHQQKKLPTEVVNAVSNTFSEYDVDFVNWYAISGNHDYSNKNLLDKQGTSALQYLSDVIGNFELLDYKMVYLDGINVHGVPYFNYKEDFVSFVNSIKLGSIGLNILMCHQTPKMIDFPIAYDFEVNDPMFDKFDLILNGHIHTRRFLSEKFYQIGVPLAQHFDDGNEENGFTVFDTDDLYNPEFVSLDFPIFSRGDKKEDGNYYKKKAAIEQVQIINSTEFLTTVSEKELIKNYCSEIGASNDILQLGLNFIK